MEYSDDEDYVPWYKRGYELEIGAKEHPPTPRSVQKTRCGMSSAEMLPHVAFTISQMRDQAETEGEKELLTLYYFVESLFEDDLNEEEKDALEWVAKEWPSSRTKRRVLHCLTQYITTLSAAVVFTLKPFGEDSAGYVVGLTRSYWAPITQPFPTGNKYDMTEEEFDLLIAMANVFRSFDNVCEDLKEKHRFLCGETRVASVQYPQFSLSVYQNCTSEDIVDVIKAVLKELPVLALVDKALNCLDGKSIADKMLTRAARLAQKIPEEFQYHPDLPRRGKMKKVAVVDNEEDEQETVPPNFDPVWRTLPRIGTKLEGHVCYRCPYCPTAIYIDLKLYTGSEERPFYKPDMHGVLLDELIFGEDGMLYHRDNYELPPKILHNGRPHRDKAKQMRDHHKLHHRGHPMMPAYASKEGKPYAKDLTKKELQAEKNRREKAIRAERRKRKELGTLTEYDKEYYARKREQQKKIRMEKKLGASQPTDE